jgi:MSHA biogenesis protein MshI
VLEELVGPLMAKTKKSKYTKQQWLYFTEHSLSLIETGLGSNSLPYLDVKASVRAANPLEAAAVHADWVQSKVSGKLNFLISNELCQLLLSDVPNVPDDEVESAIELKAADLISYDIDDAAMDIIQLPTEAYRGRMKMAFIIAMKKTPLAQWLTELIQRGIKVDIIDVEITTLRNLAVFHQNFNESGILHLQQASSRLVLNYNQEMVLSRSFDIGLAGMISETVVDDGELELTVTENSHSDIQLESLVLEVRRSFDYYESQLGLGSIAEMMFLCDEQHEHLAQEISKRLGVRFVMIRPSDFVQIKLSQEDLDPVHYFGLAGAIYREALA